MFDKVKQMWNMRKQAGKLKKELQKLEVTEEQLDGQIKVTVNGEQSLEEIEIDDELLDPDQKKKLLKHLKMAISSAMSNAQNKANEKFKEVTGSDPQKISQMFG